MTSRWLWIARQVTPRIWFRASLFSLLAIATAMVAIVVSPYIPSDLPTKIGSDAVDRILGIIASSMLTVTTFSLSTMVSAYAAATSNVTPRATKLVIEDTTTQNVLSTFIGSFLFSLVGIIVLSTGAYGDRGRVVLFVVTILVIVAIVVTLLRWIDHLARLGRVTETTQRVEEVAAAAMRERHARPYMGGRPWLDRERDIPKAARPVFCSQIGYVQHIDMGALSKLAGNGSGRICIHDIPGDLIDPTQPIAFAEGLDAEDQEERIRACFSIADVRSYDQDPRFGASVLAEIASRALSPAINDLGTAIDVIGRATRILSIWAEPVSFDIEHPNVFVPPVLMDDIFDDLFTPIARDGAALVEVGVRLQKSFLMLSRLGRDRFARNALRHSAQALVRAEAALAIEDDKRRLRTLAAEVRDEASGGRTGDG